MLKVTAVAAALIAVGIVGYNFSRTKVAAAAPEAVKAMQCPPNAPGTIDVFTVGGTKMLWPCMKPGQMDAGLKSQLAMKTERPGARYEFRKRLDGVFDFSRPESGSSSPPAANTRYAVAVSLSTNTNWEPPAEGGSGRFESIVLPTPPGFLETGSETVFRCQHFSEVKWECRSYLKSPGVIWSVGIFPGVPMAEPRSPQADVAEAYELLGQHILVK